MRLPCAPIATQARNIDYQIFGLTSTGGTAAGGPLSGTFTLDNTGADDGSATAYWTVYVSDNGILDIPGDPVVDAGSVAGGLTTAATLPATFSGTWPAAPGNRWLFATVSAADDVNGGNNQAVLGSIATTVAAPDYAVSFDRFDPALRYVGQMGAAVGDGTGRIIIDNGGTDGGEDIQWRVYRSANTVLDAGDTLIGSGAVAGGLPAAGTSNPFLNTTAAAWPGPNPGHYYLIATIDADDDENTLNDIAVSWAIAVAQVVYTAEAEPNGIGPWGTRNDQATGFNLANGVSLAIEGRMDDPLFETRDVFQFQKVNPLGTVGIAVRWNTGIDDIDLYLRNAANGALIVSQGIVADAEPGTPTLWDASGLSNNTMYYIDVFFWLDGGISPSGVAGERYNVLLIGQP